MRPVGVGFAVVGADGRGGVENDDLLAVLGGGDGFLLGEKLRTLVVADHVAERDRRVFVDDDAVGAEVHGGDAGGVDEALDAGLAGHAQQFARAVHVGAVHGFGIANPEAVVGGDVDHGVAARERRSVGSGSARSPTCVSPGMPSRLARLLVLRTRRRSLRLRRPGLAPRDGRRIRWRL